jgi:3-phosphoshikimate 1-carboxyvinyltransferase
MAEGLTRIGVNNELAPDSIRIQGGPRFHGGEIDSHDDHRIAMAFTIASLHSDAEIFVRDVDNVVTSFPGFPETACNCGLEVALA